MNVRFWVGTMLAAACATVMLACSGGGGSASTSAAPGAPSTTTTTAKATTISIVGNSGNTAFSPDVVSANTGDQVVWTNNTAVLHHIVLDDGTVVGDINPGASSAAISLKTASGNFHCTIHSTMIGSFNAAVAPTPPPCTTPGYC
jgi:plastocyanin